MGVEIGKKLPFSSRPSRRSPEWTARVSKRLGCSITTYTNPIQPEPCRRGGSARASVDLGPRDPDEMVIGCADTSSRGFDELPELRMVGRYGVGYDVVDVAAARECGVWVANVPDYGTEEVAAHALSMAFALLRHLPL